MLKERNITITQDEKLIVTVVAKKQSYSISEFAKLSGLSRSTIYRKKESGEIIFDESGKSPKISHEQLMNFKKE